eukprot:1375209-Amphidinium_carterae.1
MASIYHFANGTTFEVSCQAASQHQTSFPDVVSRVVDQVLVPLVVFGPGLLWSNLASCAATCAQVKGGADLVFSVIAFTIAAMVALCLIR